MSNIKVVGNMNLVLLSGGSGKRLWPLSNDTRSKQFFKLFKDKNDNWQSMIQRVFNQLKENDLSKSVVFTTGINQAESIINQIGNEIEVIIEPERRDTFPAIALACAYLYYNKKVDLDETVIVLPVDQYAEDEYFKLLQQIDNEVQIGHSNLVVMGIDPTYPSEKYGYILYDPINNFVSKFKEKPKKDEAVQLIKNGALWNGGVFGFKLSYIINYITRYIESNSYDDVYSNFTVFPKKSFDYEVVEKELLISLVRYTGLWKDLGTWNTLTEVMDSQVVGKAIIDKDINNNTHVINELDIPVIVLGLENVVVAASPDGVLVSSKSQSSYLKEYVEQLSERPMYEEKSWGNYRVLNSQKFQDKSSTLTKLIHIHNSERIPLQKHLKRKEIWIILNGNGKFLTEGSSIHVQQGSIIEVNNDTYHGFNANEESSIIIVQIGEVLLESDIVYHDSK